MTIKPFTLQAEQYNPEQSAEQNLKSQLRAHLDEQLQHFRSQADTADLSGFADAPERTVHVSFILPKWQRQMATHEAAEQFAAYGTDKETLHHAAKETTRQFLNDSFREEWKVTRQQGDVTVVFTDDIEDSRRVSRPRYADNFNQHGFASVNGQHVAFPDMQQFSDSLPGLVKWLDAKKHVEADGVMRFSPTVTIMDDHTVAVYSDKTLSIGAPFLHDIQDEGHMRDILRHERGHVVNRDFDPHYTPTAVLEKLRSADHVETAIERLGKQIDKSGQHLCTAPEEDIALTQKFGKALNTTVEQLAPVADSIRSYPWQEDLSAMSIAADYDNETSIAEHLADIPKVDTKALQQAQKDLTDHIRQHHRPKMAQEAQQEAPQQDASRQASPLQESFQAQLERMSPEQKEALSTIRQTFHNLHQAGEYRADIHAVQHSEQPERMAEVMKHLQGLRGTDTSPNTTHPAPEERIRNNAHFARRAQHHSLTPPETPNPPAPKPKRGLIL